MKPEETGCPSLSIIGIVDGPVDEGFDRLTKLASTLCDAPVALVSIVEEHQDRQFFTSAVGLAEPWATRRQTPLSHSFCQHVKASGAPLVVSDARVHQLVKDNLAIPELGVIAYLGVPIFGPDGLAIGALCAIDGDPREWTGLEIEHLTALSGAVSDRVKLRAALFDAEQKQQQASLFGSIVRNAQHEVFIFDAKTLKFVDVNSGAQENLGYAFADLWRMTPIDIKPEFDEATFRATIAPLLAGEVSELQLKTVHLKNDGSLYPVEIRLELHKAEPRNLVVAFCQDITVRQKLEARLRVRTADFEALFHNSPDAIIVSDVDTTIRMANPAYEKIMDQTAEQLVGRQFADHIPNAQRHLYLERLQTLTPEEPVMVTLFDHAKNDARRSVSWTNVALFDGDDAQKIFSIGRDVTELQQAKTLAEAKAKDALAADQMKEAFLANMSHEVRTPLNAMMGLFQIIEMSDVDATIKTHASTGLAAGQSMVRQLNNVLEVSRIEAKAVSLNRKTVPLAPLVAQWRDIARGAVSQHKKDIEVLAYVGESVPNSVFLDQERTTQIVMNLCDNAAKFTEAGRIGIFINTVQTDTLRPCLEIAIVDTGCGIAQPKIDNVFERFAQVDTSITRRHSGTGLGLSICRDLAILMGGHLNVECPSSIDEYATRFVLTIPAATNAGK